MSAKRKPMGGGANEITNRPTPSDIIRQEQTPSDNVRQEQGRDRLAVRLTPDEIAYLDRIEQVHGLNRTAAFRMIIRAYMRQNPL